MLEKARKILYNNWILLLTLIIMSILGNYGRYGWLFLTFILGFALWRLWGMKENYKGVLQHLETMVWGKPLERDLWERGEFKNTKVKFVWGKKEK